MKKQMNVRPVDFKTPLVALALAFGLSVLGGPAAQAQSEPGVAPQSQQSAQSAGQVNIQTANAQELERLPGIGPSRAAAIVTQRERRAFRRIEDLMRVRGIGRATFRRLRPMLTIEGSTTLAGPARRSRSGTNARR